MSQLIRSFLRLDIQFVKDKDTYLAPSMSTSASDSGNVKSPTGTSSTADRYKIFGSKNIHGLLSLMQLKRRPLA